MGPRVDQETPIYRYCTADEILDEVKIMGLTVTPGLGLRQAFADAAGQNSVV